MVMMPLMVAKSVAQMALYTMRNIEAVRKSGASSSANGDMRIEGMTLTE